MKLINDHDNTQMEVKMGGVVCGFRFDRIELSRQDLIELIIELRHEKTFELAVNYLDHLSTRFNPLGSDPYAPCDSKHKSKN